MGGMRARGLFGRAGRRVGELRLPVDCVRAIVGSSRQRGRSELMGEEAGKPKRARASWRLGSSRSCCWAKQRTPGWLQIRARPKRPPSPKTSARLLRHTYSIHRSTSTPLPTTSRPQLSPNARGQLASPLCPTDHLQSELFFLRGEGGKRGLLANAAPPPLPALPRVVSCDAAPTSERRRTAPPLSCVC